MASSHGAPVVGSEEIPVWEVSRSHLLMPEIGSTGSGVFQCFFWSPTSVVQCATGIHVVEATKDI